jgi:hypothetical protein
VTTTGPNPGDKFVCACRHCGGTRSVSAGVRAGFDDGVEDLFAENDCDCPKPSNAFIVQACDVCGETNKHWLGCAFIGLPEATDDDMTNADDVE